MDSVSRIWYLVYILYKGGILLAEGPYTHGQCWDIGKAWVDSHKIKYKEADGKIVYRAGSFLCTTYPHTLTFINGTLILRKENSDDVIPYSK